jgi:MFS family permease
MSSGEAQSAFDKYCRKELGYTFIIALGSLTFGYVMAFNGPMMSEYRPDKCEEFGVCKVSSVAATWFNAIVAIGAIVGSFAAMGLLHPKLPLGRRITTFIFSVVGTISWVLYLVVNEDRFWVGILLRFFSGFVIGGFSTVCPMYIVEISPAEATGFFGTIHQLCVAMGFVLLNLFSAWIKTWQNLAPIGAGITALCALLIWVVPEPSKEEVESGAADESSDSSIFSGGNFCQLIICCIMMFFQQFSGINAILTNLKPLLERAHIEGLDSGYSGAISSFAQVIACGIAGALIQSLGRKRVWVLSFGLIAVTDLVYGYLDYEDSHSSNHSIGRAVGSLVVIFINLLGFGAGAGPIPWFIVPELFPSSIRSLACTIVSVTNWILTFLILYGFDAVKTSSINVYGCMFIFGGCSVIATIFGGFYVKKGGSSEGAEDESKEDIYAGAESMKCNIDSASVHRGGERRSSASVSAEPLVENETV